MIISISGKSLSGKDTIGNIIQYLLLEKLWEESCPGEEIYTIREYLDNKNRCQALSNWKIVKFADKLKDCVCLILGCTREQLESQEYKSTVLGEEWWYYNVLTVGRKTKYVIYPYSEGKGKWHDSILVKPTPRLILQLLGTQCGREIIHPDIWVNATMADYKSKFRKEDGLIDTELGDVTISWIDHPLYEPTHFPNWIITDVRFPNEVEAVRKVGGLVIRVVRHNHPKDVNTNTEHESEKALDSYKDWDYEILNNGTIEDLVESVRNILKLEKLI